MNTPMAEVWRDEFTDVPNEPLDYIPETWSG